MIRLVELLWPALIPLLGYLLWHRRHLRAVARGEVTRSVRRPLFLALVSSAAIAVVCLLSYGLMQKENAPGHYRPARVKDGVLVKGHFE